MKMNKFSRSVILILLFTIIYIVIYFLLPQLFPVYRQLLLSISIFFLVSSFFLLITKKEKLYKLIITAYYYYFSFIILILIIYFITTFLVLTEIYGLEAIFNKYTSIAKILYFFICVFQNILLPLPEAATILAGSAVFGSFYAFIIGLTGTLIGVTTMFFITRYGGKKFITKYAKQKHLTRYQQLVKKNETLYLFTLFIVPILPDEIICIGAGISKISKTKFLAIATISKLITSFLFAYSFEIAEFFSITTSQILLALSVIIIVVVIAVLLYKKVKQ